MVYVELEIKGITFKLDRLLKQKLDFAKQRQRNDFDVVFLIDGDEGTGKSTLSFPCAWYLSDGNLSIDNFAEGTKDAIRKLERLPDESVMVIDEGSLMFSSRDAMKKENKRLMKILNVIRQKRMILIIVAPTFFELEKYLAYRRSKFLLHVYLDKRTGRRGRFAFFGPKKKKMLYTFGKKNNGSYAKPKASWVARFDDFQLPFHDKYLAMKRRSLKEAFDDEGEPEVDAKTKLKLRNSLLFDLVEGGVDKKQISNALNMGKSTLNKALAKEKKERTENGSDLIK